MPVYRRQVTFPVELTAPDAVAADRDAMDHAVAAIQHVEARDTSGSLSVGTLTVTDAGPRWVLVYGHGQRAAASVAEWLAAGAVDSRLVRGMWVHRPAVRDDGNGGAS